MKRTILGTLSLLAVPLLGLMAGPAKANSLKIADMPLAGNYGGPNGFHTINIDGKVCRLKNSTFGQPQGCNYEVRAGTGGDEKLYSKTNNAGCSRDCER